MKFFKGQRWKRAAIWELTKDSLEDALILSDTQLVPTTLMRFSHPFGCVEAESSLHLLRRLRLSGDQDHRELAESGADWLGKTG